MHIPIVKHHHHFLQFVYQWKVLSFELGTVFAALTLSICQCKDFHLIVFLDDTLVPIHSRYVGKGAQTFMLLIC